MMNARFIYALLLLSLATCGAPGPETAATPAATIAPAANPAVTTGPLQKRTVSREINCTGRVEIPPTDLVSIHARTVGQVTDIRYIPGDYVKKGALLLRVVNPGLIGTQRLLLETKAELQLAQTSLNRQETLAAGDATTAEQLDAARGHLDRLRATYLGLKSELTEYGVSIERLEQEGEFQSSFGIYAPQSAYVHDVFVNQGKMITPTTELMEMAGTSRMHLELQVPAQQIADLREGQEVRYVLPYDGSIGTARIERINPMVDDQTATLQVHCELNERDHQGLLPGLFLNATILAGARETTGLPRDAVVKEGDIYYGFRVTGGDYEKTALNEVNATDDFVSFRSAEGGEWVTGGAYYLGEEE